MLTPLGKQDVYPTWQAGCLRHLLESGGTMHQIRLRGPWTASLNTESGAIVYARKFHRPSGAEEQSIALKVALFHQDFDEPNAVLAVLLNGRELSAELRPAEHPINLALRFKLKELEAFNFLELHISVANGITSPTGPILDATSIPTFGSFVIESVELQIE